MVGNDQNGCFEEIFGRHFSWNVKGRFCFKKGRFCLISCPRFFQPFLILFLSLFDFFSNSRKNYGSFLGRLQIFFQMFGKGQKNLIFKSFSSIHFWQNWNPCWFSSPMQFHGAWNWPNFIHKEIRKKNLSKNHAHHQMTKATKWGKLLVLIVLKNLQFWLSVHLGVKSTILPTYIYAHIAYYIVAW